MSTQLSYDSLLCAFQGIWPRILLYGTSMNFHFKSKKLLKRFFLFMAVFTVLVSTQASAIKLSNVFSIHSDVVILNEKPKLFSHIEEEAKYFLIPQMKSEMLYEEAEKRGWIRHNFGHLAKLGTMVHDAIQQEFYQMSSYWVHKTIPEDNDAFMPMLAFAITSEGKLINTRIEGLLDLDDPPSSIKYQEHNIRIPKKAFSRERGNAHTVHQLLYWYCDQGHRSFGPIKYNCAKCGGCRKDKNEHLIEATGIYFRPEEMPELLPYFEQKQIVCPSEICGAVIPAALVDKTNKLETVCPNCEQLIFIDQDGNPREVRNASGDGEVIESKEFYFDKNPTAEQVDQALMEFVGPDTHLSELEVDEPKQPWLDGDEDYRPTKPGLPRDQPSAGRGPLFRNLAVGSVIAGIVSLVAYGVIQLSQPYFIEAYPQRIFWETTRSSQVYRMFEDSSWSSPNTFSPDFVQGSLRTPREKKSTIEVGTGVFEPDTTVKHSAKVDCNTTKGGGLTSTCKTVKEAWTEVIKGEEITKTEDVYATRYYWSEFRWVSGTSFPRSDERTVTISAVSSIPATNARGEKQRLLNGYDTSYKVFLKWTDEDGNKKQSTFYFQNEADWRAIEVDALYNFKVRGSTILEIVED